MSIEQKTIEKLVNVLGMPESSINLASNFIDDLLMDSLDTLEVVMALEEEFDIDIDDNDIEKLRTVEQLVDYVKNAHEKESA